MTQEDKELLLKDLCARLPYGVKCYIKFDDGKTFNERTLAPVMIQDFKKHSFLSFIPYLRPMSSMTEEEKEELIKNFWGSHTAKDTFEELSWYLSKHFDINELIPKGLAIEVMEENNPYEN